MRRRREKLEDALSKAKSGDTAINSEQDDMILYAAEVDDDDYVTIETEEAEDKIASMATSSVTIAEYEAEIAQLKLLERQAEKLLRGGHDCKWDELSATLQKDKDIYEEGQREKIIIFTEHRDTLDYLEANIKDLFQNDGDIVVVIHGGLTRAKRLEAVETFWRNEKASVLVATDAAGEGVNLQCAHLMINYDLPWNPNRLEQRFGRIHRIGQENTCHLWNMVAKSTREGEVFSRLLEKLENERASLGGKVFDVLGALLFDGKSLRELLMDAVCASESKRHCIIDKIDSEAVHEGIKNALIENKKDSRQFSAHEAVAIADEMRRIEIARMQPYYIEQFFVAAFKEAGGKMASSGGGKGRCYEILQVSNDIRKHNAAWFDTPQAATHQPLKRSFARVCFDRECVNMAGERKPNLIGLGSPLLNALCDATLERYGGALMRGAVLADEGDEVRLLFITEDTVVDAMGNELSRRMHFIEMKEDGTFIEVSKPPFVDCRPLSDEELHIAKEIIALKTWLQQDLKAVVSYCENTTSPRLLEEEKKKRLPLLRREAEDVDDSFFYLINDADAQYGTDTHSKSNSHDIRQRRDDRLKELQAKIDMHLDTPRVLGRAVIIPSGMLRYANGEEAITHFAADSAERKRIEKSAMQQVMDIEKKLGFTPMDVSTFNRGYDIESCAPSDEGGGIKRVIEVKGVAAEKDTVTVSRNEVNTSLTVRDNGGCYILAVVMVGESALHITYLRCPFKNEIEESANCATYDINRLKKRLALC